MEQQMMEEFGKVLAEIRSTNTELRKVQDTMGEMQRTFVDKFDNLLSEMQNMKEAHNSLKDDVLVLREDYYAVNETVTDLELQIDRLNRAAIAKHAVIYGVPSSKDENVKQLVTEIALAVNCPLADDAIVEAKRFVLKDTQQSAGKTVPIKVIFSEVRHKEELLAKKKLHGLLSSSALGIGTNSSGTGGFRIIIRDEQTSFGMKLLKEVRLIQDQAELKYVWPGRDGVILAKASDDSKVDIIRNSQDVLKLQRLRSKRPLDDSLLHSTVLSSSNAPASKHQKQK